MAGSDDAVVVVAAQDDANERRVLFSFHLSLLLLMLLQKKFNKTISVFFSIVSPLRNALEKHLECFSDLIDDNTDNGLIALRVFSGEIVDVRSSSSVLESYFGYWR